MKKDVGKTKRNNEAFKEFGKDNVVLWDVQEIQEEQLIKITFKSKNSPHDQGIRLSTDKGIEIEGNLYPSVLLWEHTAPKEVIYKCFSSDGLLSVYNIWDDGNGRESQAYSSGMIIEREDNIIVYKCNDYGFETNFDKIIFTIELI